MVYYGCRRNPSKAKQKRGMKTISVLARKGVKSKPVSLSKAAKYLTKFVESDSGASEANLGFLKRASAAFNELNAFHKEIKKAKALRSGGTDGDDVKKEVVKKEADVLNLSSREVDGRKRKKLEDGVNQRNLKKKRKKTRQCDE